MKAAWILPFMVLGGALQSCGAVMNGQLYKSLTNPWLAAAVSFALITFFFFGGGAFLTMPHTLPRMRTCPRCHGGRRSGAWSVPLLAKF